VYSHQVTMPKTKRDGLANFVQLIVNDIERGDTREALLRAVDLLQDIQSGIYDDAMTDHSALTAADKHAKAAIEQAGKETRAREEAALREGVDIGRRTERKEIARKLGLLDI
jgi:hypothetical protein